MPQLQQDTSGSYTFEGTLLDVQTFPNSILKKISSPVEVFNGKLEKLCFDMLFTMYSMRGVGLAAPQVGVSKRIFVVDIEYNRTKTSLPRGGFSYTPSEFNPLVLVNPTISKLRDKITHTEGCLSLPHIFEEVRRYRCCTVEYQDCTGIKHIIEAENLLAICLQHENDHLDGIIFIDHLSDEKREKYTKRLLKRYQKLTRKNTDPPPTPPFQEGKLKLNGQTR